MMRAERGLWQWAVGERTTIEDLGQLLGTEGSEARLLLQLEDLVGNIMESDRALLLDCARKLASRAVAHRQ